MRRFHISQLPERHEDLVDLPSDVLRHLSTVLRLQAGDRFELFDGAGGVARCVLAENGSQARIEQQERLAPPELQIELIQGLAKGEKLDLILQKGTELGVSRFILSPTERAVLKVAANKRESRMQRWRRITLEACTQCGQPFAPHVDLSKNLSEALAAASGELKLMLWEEETLPLAQLLPAAPPASLSLLVGPEGGFSPAEARLARAAGFHTVRLGPRILRTETAGLAILSILQYVYGDFATNEGGFSSITHGKELS